MAHAITTATTTTRPYPCPYCGLPKLIGTCVCQTGFHGGHEARNWWNPVTDNVPPLKRTKQGGTVNA